MRKDEFPIVDKYAKDKVKEVLNKIEAEIEQMQRKKANTTKSGRRV